MPFAKFHFETKTPVRLIQTWTRFRQNKAALFSFYGLCLLLGLIIFAPEIIPHALDQQFLGNQLVPPAWSRNGNISFFFGTDDLGRDILSRLLMGTRYTFGAAIIATVAAVFVGCLLGVWAGITSGFRSALINHIFDILLALPSLVLAIVIVSLSGPRLEHAIFAVWLALIPRMVRTVSSAVHDELEKEYVVAARLDGAKTPHILWHSILPNIAPILIAEFTRALTMAILDISALGFLGLGAQPPYPEWGTMLGDSLELLYVAPWTVILPGVAILLCAILSNLFGEGIRRAINTGEE